MDSRFHPLAICDRISATSRWYSQGFALKKLSNPTAEADNTVFTISLLWWLRLGGFLDALEQ